jgi:LysM repeat protein
MALVVVTSSALVVAGRAASPPGKGAGGFRPARSYVVRPGDTLWGIARRQVGPRADPRPAVDLLARANHLADARLVPGQVLVLP